ncbi:hypothetical protein [Stenotrophomonas rhizophila]|uniref:hypothetical protein n=1 Tax=Stenotrophomonas rhizophila TaxID=216778 RepID=UPI00112F1862|nr:hypothetical protein [Stenotrophomonas rhizophila]
MELKDKLRFSLLALGGALVSLLQRPFFLLVLTIGLYLVSERLLGVVPLKLFELTEAMAGAKEATLAAAGLVVAIVSVSAFKHAKRLDLELAASAEISSISSDLITVLSRYGIYCEKVLEIKSRFVTRYDPGLHPAARAELDRDLKQDWTILLTRVRDISADRDEIWSLIRRLIEVSQKHQPVLGSRFLTPIMLERAQFHLEAIANAATFPVPEQDHNLVEYMRVFILFGVSDVNRYMHAERKHKIKLLGYLGGASSIGSTTIAPRSAMNAVRMAWKLMRLRE